MAALLPAGGGVWLAERDGALALGAGDRAALDIVLCTLLLPARSGMPPPGGPLLRQVRPPARFRK